MLQSKVVNKVHPWMDLPSKAYFNPATEDMKVAMNVVVLNLADISTANLCYRMRLELWVAWPLTEKEVRNYIIDPDNWIPDIHPDPVPWTISIEESSKMPFMSGRTTQVFMWRGKIVACECTLVTARYLESMELVNFPFDGQHFNFHIGLRCDCDMPLQVEGEKVKYNTISSVNGFLNFDGRAMSRLKLNPEGCTFNVRTSLLSLEDFNVGAVECEIENMEFDIPFLHCSIRIARIYTPYMYRIFLPMFILMLNCGLALRFTSGLDDRLSFIITNIFAIVTFLFTINTLLPQIPYLTIVDKYMNFGFVYCGLVACGCVLLNYFEYEGTDEEGWILVALQCFLFVVHILLCFYFRHMRTIEMQKMKYNRHEVDDLEAERVGPKNIRDKDEFLVHSDIHPIGAHNVYNGSLRRRITPKKAAGWLNEGGGRLLKDGEKQEDDTVYYESEDPAEILMSE